jgi:hypothetical protein
MFILVKDESKYEVGNCEMYLDYENGTPYLRQLLSSERCSLIYVP